VARMVMFGLEFTGRVPFADVPVHSVIQSPEGRRMSKSLGTGIDPLEEIDAHGADALRFGLLAMSSSQDVPYSAKRVGQGQNLANKLWNASRLILLRVDEGVEPSPRAAETVEDRWIVSRLERTTRRVTELLDAFQFSAAALELYGAFWSELCDWYLELAKPRLYGERSAGVSAVLLHALERSLRLLHPVMPFVTEEIWSFLPGERDLLAVADWPAPDDSLIDEEAERTLDRVREVVTELRRYRDEVGAKASARIPARLVAEGYEETAEQIARLARFELVSADSPDGQVFAALPVPGGVVQVLSSDAFDAEEARRRLRARRADLRGEIERAERKLSNAGFVEKAPVEVVEEERRKLGDRRRALERLGDD
jgi:valyl-tRNA synthetase